MLSLVIILSGFLWDLIVLFIFLLILLVVASFLVCVGLWYREFIYAADLMGSPTRPEMRMGITEIILFVSASCPQETPNQKLTCVTF